MGTKWGREEDHVTERINLNSMKIALILTGELLDMNAITQEEFDGGVRARCLVLWLHESETTEYVADSFAEFIERLHN
ncbi:SMI1/KNR4 family protein [Paenibacillus antarcticus]|uniref:Knr4/Smi1-like domain-containing protein n=1 Tax=Paenibacillus antarcticus TaxID=253703 RepID=A0A162Q159_9BACL|nr:SMI1/KNR4 family protein [Paenibacillus antarcticus]OAB41210.1 hypothetical protein PBAT_21900 [Paenibacillus antarcticus]